MKSPKPLIIAIDKKEKKPYSFRNSKLVDLKTGDYTIYPLKDRKLITIERKTPAELFGNFGKQRKRFQAEFLRLKEFHRSILVIEGNVRDILQGNTYSQVSISTVMNSLISWWIKYNVPFVFVGSRENGRAFVYRTLERYWIYYQKAQDMRGD